MRSEGVRACIQLKGGTETAARASFTPDLS